MFRKIIIIVLIVVLTGAALYFYQSNNDDDSKLTRQVIELEKNLVLAQIQRISFEDFKNNTSAFIHPIYGTSFYEEKAKQYNMGNLAASTQIPLYEEISKVYTSEDKKSKYVFVIISDEHIANLAAYQYQFIQHEGQWKIRNIKFYTLSKDMTRPPKDAAKFTIFNGKTIEYKHTKIIE